MKSRKSFLLRIDPELHKALEGWAAQELRSLNGQIEYLLKEAVNRRRKADLVNTADHRADEKDSGRSEDKSIT